MSASSLPRFDQLPAGVELDRWRPDGSILVCHHDEQHRQPLAGHVLGRTMCGICKTQNYSRRVRLLAHVPAPVPADEQPALF